MYILLYSSAKVIHFFYLYKYYYEKESKNFSNTSWRNFRGSQKG